MSQPNTTNTATGMSQLVPVPEPHAADGRAPFARPEARGRWCCEQLEQGNILLLSSAPFDFSDDERAFLLAQRQSGASYHKNVAYRPGEDRLTGYAGADGKDAERLRTILRRYSDRADRCLKETLPPYARGCRRDFASFRPLEERNRNLRLRARNDLLHTDAFPTRPTNGDRILRLFTNLNPSEPRVWVTSETFEPLARRYARDAGLDRCASATRSVIHRVLRGCARAIGISTASRSGYDVFMLRFHNYLKENAEFQRTCRKSRWEFPPGATWMVFTDMVSHAVLSGQFALEQTFIVPRDALVLPDKAPASILESLCGSPLTLN